MPAADAPIAPVTEGQHEEQLLREEPDQGRSTMVLAPPPDSGSATVMLEAVHVLPAPPQAPSGPPPAKRPPAAKQAEKPSPPEEITFRPLRLAETEMDMTPMVDVTFQLLIFFMITAAFALQKAKEIPKPKLDEPSPNLVVPQDDALDRVVVRIDENNTFTVINLDGDEDEAASLPDLYVRLRRARTGSVGGKPPTKLRVEAHGDALHEKVVAALDAGNETGFAEMELAMTPDDAE
jgi:biopolymer transport protein ExbD